MNVTCRWLPLMGSTLLADKGVIPIPSSRSQACRPTTSVVAPRVTSRAASWLCCIVRVASSFRCASRLTIWSICCRTWDSNEGDVGQIRSVPSTDGRFVGSRGTMVGNACSFYFRPWFAQFRRKSCTQGSCKRYREKQDPEISDMMARYSSMFVHLKIWLIFIWHL